MTKTQIAAIAQLLSAIAETVADSGEQGAPGGVLYAALMHVGVTLSQFDALMGVLVASGRMQKIGDLYFSSNVRFTPIVNPEAGLQSYPNKN